MSDDTASRERAEMWAETHCPSCGMPRASDADWRRHDEGGECADGCECAKCASVCWDEFSCESGDDDHAVTCYLAGAREEAAIKDARIEMLEAELRAAEDESGISNVTAQHESQLAVEREEIAKLRDRLQDVSLFCSAFERQVKSQESLPSRLAETFVVTVAKMVNEALPSDPGGAE